jgi:cardiolipin synthase
MKTLIVGIPVLRDTRRFHFEKGRRWTIFEHLVLEALAKSDWTIADLQAASDLPRRVLIEILIRLMRVGWVELLTTAGTIVFRSTALGRLNATREELPPVTKSAARFLSFAVDRLTGTIFRGRDLTTTPEKQWGMRTSGRAAVLINPAQGAPEHIQADVRRLADTLLESDEVLTRVEFTDMQPRRRIALVAVRGKEIEGLGRYVPDALKNIILNVAKEAGVEAQRTSTSLSVDAPRGPEKRLHHQRGISFHPDDLILDGQGHRGAFNAVFAKAQHRVILHSTFISLAHAMNALPMMKACAARGTRIDILWGKSDNKDEVNTTRKAAAEFRQVLAREGIDDRVRVHQTSTHSHAKLVLYDLGDPNRYAALIGSCNWLSSGFFSFEATVRLRDPSIVADIAFELAELSRPRDGQIPDLASELARLGKNLELAIPSAKTNGTAQLILGSEHTSQLHVARDESQHEIMLLSHRLGVAAKPVLKTLTAAAKARNVVPTVYYGRLNKPVKSADAVREADKLRVDGVELTPIAKPRIHAKVLCWDDDNIVVTSLNWLSADPSEDNMRAEIGIQIHAPGVAKSFRKQLSMARDLEEPEVTL